jgi:DNA-binding CsgD family transcriptional regulator
VDGAFDLHVAPFRDPLPRAAAVAVVLRCAQDQASPKRLSAGLTLREDEVARLIGHGMSTKEIAHALGISCHTARHHTEALFAKLGVRSRAAVAAIVAGHAAPNDFGRVAAAG